MFTKYAISILVAALLCIAAMSYGSSQQTPFVCNMGKLTSEQRDELSKAIHRLIDAKPAAKELPNGYEMKFARGGDLFVTAATWIRYERECCPFFEFSISLASNGGPMIIRLTGPKGGKACIDEDLPGLKKMTSP